MLLFCIFVVVWVLLLLPLVVAATSAALSDNKLCVINVRALPGLSRLTRWAKKDAEISNLSVALAAPSLQSMREPMPPVFEEQIDPLDTDETVTWRCRVCGRWNREPLKMKEQHEIRMKVRRTRRCKGELGAMVSVHRQSVSKTMWCATSFRAKLLLTLRLNP